MSHSHFDRQGLISDYRDLSRNRLPISTLQASQLYDDDRLIRVIAPSQGSSISREVLDSADPVERREAIRHNRMASRILELQVNHFPIETTSPMPLTDQAMPVWLRPDLKAAAITELRALSLVNLQRKVCAAAFSFSPVVNSYPLLPFTIALSQLPGFTCRCELPSRARFIRRRSTKLLGARRGRGPTSSPCARCLYVPSPTISLHILSLSCTFCLRNSFLQPKRTERIEKLQREEQVAPCSISLPFSSIPPLPSRAGEAGQAGVPRASLACAAARHRLQVHQFFPFSPIISFQPLFDLFPSSLLLLVLWCRL